MLIINEQFTILNMFIDFITQCQNHRFFVFYYCHFSHISNLLLRKLFILNKSVNKILSHRKHIESHQIRLEQQDFVNKLDISR